MEKSDQINTVLKKAQPEGDGSLPDNQPAGMPQLTSSIAMHRKNFRNAMASA